MADRKLASVQGLTVKAITAVLASVDTLHKEGLKTHQVVKDLTDATSLLGIQIMIFPSIAYMRSGLRSKPATQPYVEQCHSHIEIILRRYRKNEKRLNKRLTLPNRRWTTLNYRHQKPGQVTASK